MLCDGHQRLQDGDDEDTQIKFLFNLENDV